MLVSSSTYYSDVPCRQVRWLTEASEAITMAAERVNRRTVLANGVRGACALGIGGLTGFLVARNTTTYTVWQIDPYKCNQCGNCATYCVLKESAVKAVHGYGLCGYCDLCTGYFVPSPTELDTGAENQLCPTGAIKRKFVEEPYFEYTIDEPLCSGCGKCVKGCATFGNGSLFLQVRHDRCLNCNECSIAAACPAQAFVRVPADKPYLLKEGSIRT
jgi:electron transport complex protein RnfB